MTIRNTAAEAQTGDGAMALLVESFVSGDNFVERQEAAGQRQLVESEQLPTDRNGDPQAWADAGFTFTDAEPGDPLFCKATLPDGWTKRPTEHSMWSEIVDPLARVRVKIFYKAAFYDRRAFARLVTPAQYVWSEIQNDRPLVLDDTWLTPQTALDALATLEKNALEEAASAELGVREGHNTGYWQGRAAEHHADAAKYRNAAQAISAEHDISADTES